MAKKQAASSAFDQMMSEFLNSENGALMLEDCMSFEFDRVNKVPLRYRIIALGFVKHYTLQQLNEELTRAGCPQLYSRSLMEAGLIYAFLNGMSYSEWRNLEKECVEIRDAADLSGAYLRGSSFTLRDLQEYVNANSDEEEQLLETKHLTRMIMGRIEEAVTGRADFRSFLNANLDSFSVVREKTRYYFCKYLCYDLETRIARYLEAEEKGQEESAVGEISVFRGLTKLKRKKMTPEEIRETLETSAVSCGEIFDAFNFFYFEYISLDWMEVLLEYYGNIEDMPPKEQKKLAASLRHYDAKKYGKLSDREILRKKQEELDAREEELDEIYSLSGENRGYQKNRVGENTIRKYIRGSLDIDRTTLVSFLLFFGSESRLPEEMKITPERLTEILLECGYPGLRPDDDFDAFVVDYLRAEDPTEFLMEQVTGYAKAEENFYLYQMYKASTSYDEEFRKVTGDL